MLFNDDYSQPCSQHYYVVYTTKAEKKEEGMNICLGCTKNDAFFTSGG